MHHWQTGGDEMEFVEAIQKAGVVGAGGAGFPTHIKQNAAAEYLIINAAECEPLIETDKYLCRTFADRIVETVEKMAAHLKAGHRVIALKAKYKQEIKALKEAIDRQKAGVEIFEMGTYYPAGDEQIMVEQVTGRVVPERGLPLNVGCVVENVGTVPICEEEILLAVSDAVLERAFPGHVEEVKARLSNHTDLSLLSRCPFLLINEGNRVRTLANEMFEDAQITPQIVLETENIETVLALSVKGMGITFYPKMFMSSHGDINDFKDKVRRHTSMNFYSLDSPKAHGTLGIGFHKGHYMSQAAREFIRIAKEVLL